MSASPALVIMAALLAGGVSAVGTASLLSDPAPAADSASSAALLAVDQLRDEVVRLADEQSSLQRQLQVLEMRASSSASSPSAAREIRPLDEAPPELSELRQQVAQLSARLEGSGPLEPAAMQTVSAALEQIREQEDLERREARAEARRQRDIERTDELAEELALDSYQKQKLGGLVTSYGESSEAVVEAARASGDWGGMRQSFDALHGELNESLTSFLTPTQLEELEQLGGPRALSSSGWGSWGRSNRGGSSSGR